jgi:hypothetical protein
MQGTLQWSLDSQRVPFVHPEKFDLSTRFEFLSTIQLQTVLMCKAQLESVPGKGGSQKQSETEAFLLFSTLVVLSQNDLFNRVSLYPGCSLASMTLWNYSLDHLPKDVFLLINTDGVVFYDDVYIGFANDYLAYDDKMLGP